MARNRRNSQDTAIAQLIALAVLGCAFSPLLRGLLLWGLVAVVAGLGAAVMYRLATGQKRFDWAASERSVNPFVQHGGTVLRANAPAAKSRLDEELRSLEWFQFERLVAAVFGQQRYAVSRPGGANPDGGIDLVISQNGIVSAVQCKHWKTWKVGVKEIREFLGALADRRIQNGIFVTLQGYTGDAKELAARHNIRLIGENELMEMLEAANWRFNPAFTAVLDDTRKLCPKCESEMVLRTAKKGNSVGSQFWGCSAYPRCRFTFEHETSATAAR